jgi:dihydropteroate synthase
MISLGAIVDCTGKPLDLSQPKVMGILNITPDSFSDGGDFFSMEKALEHAHRMVSEGAAIIDVGGESTRPGAPPVPLDMELDRVIPVIEELAGKIDVPISIDTTKADVAKQALDAGAEIINDISALRFDPDMVKIAAHGDVPVVLMHMTGSPETMQKHIHYDSLIDDIYGFFQERIDVACQGGVDQNKIIIDPGIGFGKSVEKDNFTILARLDTFSALGKPILAGPSRKAFIGRLLGKDVDEREEGTCAAVAIAVYNGAGIVRVHNVGMMKMVARVVDEIKKAL